MVAKRETVVMKVDEAEIMTMRRKAQKVITAAANRENMIFGLIQGWKPRCLESVTNSPASVFFSLPMSNVNKDTTSQAGKSTFRSWD